MAKRQGTPLWATVGCGCGLLVLLVIGAIVAAGFFGASALKGYMDDMKDPAARATRAGELLGVEQLPEGYSAQFFLRIPWLFDMVVLSDSEPVVIEDDDFEFEADTIGEHFFAYFSIRDSDVDHEEFERMLRGEASAEGVRTDLDLEIESDQELSRGSFDLGDQQLSYVGHRGEIDLDGGDVDGIYSQILIDCPGDELTRAAVWFQRQRDGEHEASGSLSGGDKTTDKTADKTADQLAIEILGTPADEATLRRFMDHFNVCHDA